MEYAQIGATGVHVSPLCLGTMSFRSEADEHVTADMFKNMGVITYSWRTPSLPWTSK